MAYENAGHGTAPVIAAKPRPHSTCQQERRPGLLGPNASGLRPLLLWDTQSACDKVVKDGDDLMAATPPWSGRGMACLLRRARPRRAKDSPTTWRGCRTLERV